MAHFVRRCLSRLLSPRISSSPPLLTSHVGGTKEDEHPDPPFVKLGTETSFKLAHRSQSGGQRRQGGTGERKKPRPMTGCL